MTGNIADCFFIVIDNLSIFIVYFEVTKTVEIDENELTQEGREININGSLKPHFSTPRGNLDQSN